MSDQDPQVVGFACSNSSLLFGFEDKIVDNSFSDRTLGALFVPTTNYKEKSSSGRSGITLIRR